MINSVYPRLTTGISIVIAAMLPMACTRTRSAEAPETPHGLQVMGQRTSCGNGPHGRTFYIPTVRADINVGMGMKTQAWTFGGTVPGPLVEACEGDSVTVISQNQDTDPVMGTDHGLDSHAFKIDAKLFGPTAPGSAAKFTATVDVPGVFMYHCAAGPATDWHMKTGLYGAMIVYPRKTTLRPAKEFVVVQSGIYGEPDNNRVIVQKTDKARANNPFFVVFNGTTEHEPVALKAGELVRIYFVNVGPGLSAVHIIGTILERFYASGNPENTLYDVQTAGVPPGSGAMFEFRPPKGNSALVDHDNLRYLDYGLVIPFVGQ